MWKRLCSVLEANELCDDPRFSSPGRRSRNRDALSIEMEKRLEKKTGAEWIEALNDAGVPSGPILSIDQVFANEQVQHLGLATPIAHPQLGEIQVLGLPITLSRTPGGVRTPTAEKGEHSEDILSELGFSAEDIRQLREDEVV
jgi:formyl-CoA transferase